ncbi:MAG: ABC transporter ATP-binding protein [Butyrivibrio sp.]|nr:ABC transporter ATP-binding protein [Butyrivibrio sp.]
MKSKMEQSYQDDVIILCDELVKIYMSDGLKVMALQGLDLEVRRGEMLAIIGKSGSGKSTLLNMIGGLENPTAGRLVICGKDMAAYTDKELTAYRKKTVGFVWQKSSRNLFPFLTAKDNVEMPMLFMKRTPAQRSARAMELLEMVGMAKYADKFPGQLSGGEQQRIAIAVALAGEPEILLADEPTGAVDSKTSDNIFDLFTRLNREMGITIIIVTHDTNLAKKVDRVVSISDGKIGTEKLRNVMSENSFADELEGQTEFSVLDKAHRVQLTDEVLEAAGINSNRVRVHVEDGKVVIEQE